MLRFLIVGSGYRARFYGRIAKRYPEQFQALFLCRSQEKASLCQQETGTEATFCYEEARAFGADFVVVAVDKAHIYQVSRDWALEGYPVLLETPAGSTLKELELFWELERQVGPRLACAEQYLRYPILSQGRRLVEEGLIGEPRSMYLSLAHDYHGFSLIRSLLRTGGEGYELQAVRTTSPMVETDSRGGATFEGRLQTEERVSALITFSGGKTAVYDFASPQYHSFIRGRHLTLRGERGEWNDRYISYLDGENLPQRAYLMPEVWGKYRKLDTKELQDLRKVWSPELSMENVQDEFAMASLLMDMEGCVRPADPVSPYPLREALEDAYFWLLLGKAAREGGRVSSSAMPWNG